MILYSLFYCRMLFCVLFYVIFISGVIRSDDVNKYCLPNVCPKNQQHTLCKFPSSGPAAHCINYELTIKNESDRQLVLDKINARRDKVASGEIRSLPPAEDMFKMEWNEELAESAQRWADQCVSNGIGDMEDDCRNLEKMPVGQNVATVYGEAPGLTPTALVDVWYMQLLNINASLLLRYRPSNEVGSATYNQFTQLVWASSSQVGCGGVKFKENFEDAEEKKERVVYRLVCNFAPRGNQLGQAVYLAGQAGAQCDYGISSIHKALCNSQTIRGNENTKFDDEKPEDLETTTDGLNMDEPSTINNQTTVLTTEDHEYDTTFDYFSHLYELTKDHVIPTTTEREKCKNDFAVDDIIEIVKNKLIEDPALKPFFTTSTPTTIKDEKVAAFLNKIYNKITSTTRTATATQDYVNSTLLVNLVEAVIFRSTEKIQEQVTSEMDMESFVTPIKVQVLSAMKQGDDFTGHYFFPEYDDEETSKATTVADYDNSYGASVQDVALDIEEIRKKRPTKDFLDEIFETESIVESTKTTMKSLSPDNIKLHTSGYSNMRNFLKDIAEKSESNKNKHMNN